MRLPNLSAALLAAALAVLPLYWCAPASAEETLFTADGAFSFSLSPSSWSVQSFSSGTVFARRDGGALLLVFARHTLYNHHKDAKAVPILVRNALCKSTDCAVSQIAERFATGAGPAVYRTSLLQDGKDRRAYLVQTDGRYFAAEQSGLSEEEVVRILSSAKELPERTETAQPSRPMTAVQPPGSIPPSKLPALSSQAASSGWALAAQAAASAFVALFGLRLLIPAPEAPALKIEEGSPYPLRIEKRYLHIFDVLSVKDSHKRRYRIASPDPALLLKAGLLLFIAATLAELACPLAAGKACHALLQTLPHYALVLAFSGVVTSFIYKRSFNMTDEKDGSEVLTVTQGISPSGSRVFHVYDSSDKLVSIIEQESRILSLARRRWRLKDTEGNTHIEMVEDGHPPALARKLLGHCCGLLRSSYLVQERYGAVGDVRPEGALADYTVRMNFSATDHRIVAAMAAVIYLVTPDRWHPWFD